MKVLIAGLGSIGQRHINNLRKLVPLEVVAYRVRGNSLPENFQGDWLTEYNDLEQALSTQPKAALICGPPRTQMQVALAAANAGCHLFIEKPISNSLEGVEELISTVRSKNLVTLIGYNLRFHPGLGLIKSLLKEERIGKVVSIRAQVGQYLPDWHPWEDYRQTYSARKDLGGGAVLDLIHELDYVRWLGGEVQKVSGFLGRLSHLEIDTEDVAEIMLQFEKGAIGNVHVDYVQRVATRNCQIIGDQGSITWDALKNEVHLFEVRNPEWQLLKQEEFDRNDMYLAEMKHFLACIEGKEESIVDIEDGAKTLKVALFACKSALHDKAYAVK